MVFQQVQIHGLFLFLSPDETWNTGSLLLNCLPTSFQRKHSFSGQTWPQEESDHRAVQRDSLISRWDQALMPSPAVAATAGYHIYGQAGPRQGSSPDLSYLCRWWGAVQAGAAPLHSPSTKNLGHSVAVRVICDQEERNETRPVPQSRKYFAFFILFP